ncbi:MAG: zinc ABC transporter substrate-binding protein [Spirochaetales bacterium]|nr:zinc ABC transporter substrate-binding protein [Spirochaetales bacterium]
MKNRWVLIPIILIVFLLGCRQKSTEQSSSKILSVVTTTGMIADSTRAIAGERADVIALMGPGVDPHLYKASAGDVRRLQEANLILFNGLHLESRMGEVLEKLAESRAVRAVAEAIPEQFLIPSQDYADAHDPHVWFDVSLWTYVAQAIAQELMAIDPEGKAVYEANLRRYLEELDSLEREVKDALAIVPEGQRILITAHDAFGYFGVAHDFEVKGLQGISTVSEAGAKDVQQLADFIATQGIPAVFVESSVPRRTIEALQAAVQDRGFNVEIGGELFSDAMGEEGTVEGTYPGMVRHNTNAIAQALGEK